MKLQYPNYILSCSSPTHPKLHTVPCQQMSARISLAAVIIISSHSIKPTTSNRHGIGYEVWREAKEPKWKRRLISFFHLSGVSSLAVCEPKSHILLFLVIVKCAIYLTHMKFLFLLQTCSKITHNMTRQKIKIRTPIIFKMIELLLLSFTFCFVFIHLFCHQHKCRSSLIIWCFTLNYSF